jgi:ligand-binding SRPBCC domain-containing protein
MPAMARSHVLERSQLVPAPRAEVFAFFGDAWNLEAITPQFLRFRVTTPGPIPMAPGALIDYRLSLYGVGFRWRTRIEIWEPGVRFVDVQLSGPYRRWRHTHTFEDAPGGTRVLDRVEYELPLGPLGHLAHAVFVRRALARIFDHRRARIAERFGAPPARAGLTPPGAPSAPGSAPAGRPAPPPIP